MVVGDLLTLNTRLEAVDCPLSFRFGIVGLLLGSTAPSFKKQMQTAFCEDLSFFRRIFGKIAQLGVNGLEGGTGLPPVKKLLSDKT